ncbi:unnamed protein product, partial [Didymodactylos carnosus]
MLADVLFGSEFLALSGHMRLTIWLECLSDLCTLFTYLPLLEYLSIQGTSRTNLDDNEHAILKSFEFNKFTTKLIYFKLVPGGHRSFDYDLFDRIIRNLTNLKSLSFDLFTKERNIDGYRLQKTLSSINLSYLEFRLVLCYYDYPCHRNPQITNENVYLCSTFTQIQQWNICCHYDVLRQSYLIYTKPWINNVAFGWIFEVLINTELKNDFYNVKYVNFCNSDKQHLTFNLLTKYFPNIIHLRLFQEFDPSPSLLSLRSTTEITKPLILNYCTTLITHDSTSSSYFNRILSVLPNLEYLTVQNNCLYECEKNLIPKRIRRLNLIVTNRLYELTNSTLCRFLQLLECLWIEDNNDTPSSETMNIVQLVEQLFTQLPFLYNFKYIKEKKNIDFSVESFDKMLLFYSVELEDNFYDESCFRSGETTAKRWISSEMTTPFFSKGRGRSLILSDFLTAHPDNPFFQLSVGEWRAATAKHPELLEEDYIKYIERSASASIQVGYEGYFDNDAVISQFTRLFKMLPFKEAYQNHSINIIVDNARTHSAKEFSLEGFGMKVNTRYAVDQIQYFDETGKQQTIDCYFKRGENKGKSKGLLVLAKELKVKIPVNVKLEELKRLLGLHRAFQN